MNESHMIIDEEFNYMKALENQYVFI